MKSFVRSIVAGAVLAATAQMTWAQDAAETAVEAAKKYAGEKITVTWPAGAGALDPKLYVVPKFEEETGVDVELIEIPIGEMFAKTVAEHRAGTGAFDVLSIVPSWLADMALAGVVEPLDPFVEKYDYADDLEDIAPAYRDNQMRWGDTIYAIPDDGDLLMLFYRKDLFEDPVHMAAFKEKYGYDLRPPETWDEFSDIGNYFNDSSEDLSGAAFIRRAGLLHYFFEERYRVEGGKFFDPETMDALINSDLAVQVVTEMVEDNSFMPAGVADWGPIEVLNAWLAGKVAMAGWWPPVGRWSEGLKAEGESMKFVPPSTVQGNVGYALPPGGRPQLALGWSLGVSTNSANKELAYLFIQYANSPSISLERVQLPYAFRDPFRQSHYESEEYRNKWPTADAYLEILREGAESGLLDLSIRNTFLYEEALQRALGRAMAGEDPKTVMDDAAREWNDLTERVGVDKQREAYQTWAAKPNAYPN